MKGQETIEAEDTNQVPQAVTGQGVGNLPVTGVVVPVHADGGCLGNHECYLVRGMRAAFVAGHHTNALAERRPVIFRVLGSHGGHMLSEGRPAAWRRRQREGWWGTAHKRRTHECKTNQNRFMTLLLYLGILCDDTIDFGAVRRYEPPRFR